jgi:phenylalanyl-tRNA synthetase beta chain
VGRTLPDTRQVGALSADQRDRRRVADALVGLGFSEAVTLPLVAPGDLERAGAPVDRVVAATNPLRSEESVLRTRVRPGLLRAVAFNVAHGLGDVALFEMGHVFVAPRDGHLLPEEPDHLAFVVSGLFRRRPIEADRAVDLYDGTDAVRAVADVLELSGLEISAADAPGFRPGAAARVAVDGGDAGVVGVVDEGVCAALGLAPPVIAGELSLSALFTGRRRDRSFRSPSKYPASTIDLAFVLPVSAEGGAVAAVLAASAPGLVEAVELFDEYRSDAMGFDRRSLAFALRYRAPDRTLTDGEVAELRRSAIEAVVERFGGELRG